MRHLFVVDSLDKQIQNEKELIHLASAGMGGQNTLTSITVLMRFRVHDSRRDDAAMSEADDRWRVAYCKS